MKTEFTEEQLRDPGIARSNEILRACVHCGFCTATCPTYQVLGDELDSPRGRIYLIKDMLENERVPDAKTVKHIDRCLSCLACMTTCPSGVHYMHLVDHARDYIERNYKRPFGDRALRWILSAALTSVRLRSWASRNASSSRPFASMYCSQSCSTMASTSTDTCSTTLARFSAITRHCWNPASLNIPATVIVTVVAAIALEKPSTM